jgi:Flp pilus assembly protein TadB
MLWTIAIIFFLLWALGLVSSVTLSGYIHVLLGVAVALLLVQFVKNRNRKRLGHSKT